MSHAFLMVYITASSLKEAKLIAKTLVTEKLAACANIVGGIQSVFCWQEKLISSKEVALLLKTTPACLEELVARVKAIHSYDCPCVVTWRITGGNEDFLQWIATSVKTNLS